MRFNDGKTFSELTISEQKARATLTPKEQAAVNAFIAAAKALPKSLCVSLEEPFDNEPNLTVCKRITAGAATRVASLRKTSLYF